MFTVSQAWNKNSRLFLKNPNKVSEFGTQPWSRRLTNSKVIHSVILSLTARLRWCSGQITPSDTFEQRRLPLCYRDQIMIPIDPHFILAFNMLLFIWALYVFLACSPTLFDIATRLHHNTEYQNVAIEVTAQPVYSKASFCNCTIIILLHSSVKAISVDNYCKSLHNPNPIDHHHHQQQKFVYCVKSLC